MNTLYAIAAGSLAAVFLSEVTEPIYKKAMPPSRYMALDSLTYAAGEFTQTHLTSVEGLQADWTAKIMDGGRQVCPTGNGKGSYSNEIPNALEIDLWVGADVLGYSCEDRLFPCQEYTGLASWEYLNDKGQRVTITGEVRFVYNCPQ